MIAVSLIKVTKTLNYGFLTGYKAAQDFLLGEKRVTVEGFGRSVGDAIGDFYDNLLTII